MTTEKPVDDVSDLHEDVDATDPTDHGDTGTSDTEQDAAAGAEKASRPGVLAVLASRLRRTPDDSSDGSSSSKRGRITSLPVWQQSIGVVVLAVILAVVFKALFLQVFTVPTASMEPTLKSGDKIVVAKPPYWFGGSPSRGDVIVFKDPGGWLGNSDRDHTTGFARILAGVGLHPTGGHLVKRVIGVAGDTVTCCDEDGRIQVNGYALDEKGYTSQTFPDGSAIPCEGPEYSNCTWTSGVIPKGDLFVMGDNRGDSADSSAHLECVDPGNQCKDSPFVPVSDVVGKVEGVLWPLGHFKHLSTPSDFANIPDPE